MLNVSSDPCSSSSPMTASQQSAQRLTDPSDDAIEAIIHHATSYRQDLRPLRDTRTQLFVGNVLSPTYFSSFFSHPSTSYPTEFAGRTSKISSAKPAPFSALMSLSVLTIAAVAMALSSSRLQRTQVEQWTCSTDTHGRHASLKFA